MRFNCKIRLKTKENEIKIPSDYRKFISSLIKEAFKKSDKDGEEFFEKVFAPRTQKPYTFSVVFPIKEYKDKFFILKDNFFNFNFSSADYEFLIRIYNGLLKLRNGFKIFGDNVEVESFNLFLKPNYTFKEKVLFKTLSPILIRNPENGDEYLVLEGLLNGKKFKYVKEVKKENLLDALKKNIESIIEMGLKRNLLNNDFDKNFEINILKLDLSPALHSSNRSNFLITLPAMKGTIEIKGSSVLLKFLYETGIGARRSEGFGMVEVVKQCVL